MRQRVTQKSTSSLSLLFQSFGYKFGVPTDADYVFDVRCLPNPFWQNGLSSYTGLDAAVATFLQSQPSTQHMLDDIILFLEKWIPQIAVDNRSYLTIAIGCTGGQHRSVYIAEQLALYFKQQQENIQIHHREIG